MSVRDQVNECIEQANEANTELKLSAYLGAARVYASLAIADEQRVANRLQAALIEQLGEVARLLTGPEHPTDPAVPLTKYLSREELHDLGVRGVW